MDIGIGTIDVQWIWGQLSRSDWVDSTATSPRFLTGAVASLSPSFVSGLTVGGARVFYLNEPPTGIGASDYFLVFQSVTKSSLSTPGNPEGNDARDQLMALYARWVLTPSGFEVYGEWARDDHSWDWRDLILEPEHSAGTTFGLQKIFQLGDGRLLAVKAEAGRLDLRPTFQVRAEPTYYVHSAVPAGYTQEGRIIGSWVGPGGSFQYLGVYAE